MAKQVGTVKLLDGNNRDDIGPRTMTVQTFDDGWQYIVIADPAYTWNEADIACAREAMAEAAKPLPIEELAR